MDGNNYLDVEEFLHMLAPKEYVITQALLDNQVASYLYERNKLKIRK